MADQQHTPPEDEQATPQHSPVEEEYQANEPGGPAQRDAITIFGYSLGIVLAAVFVLFVVITMIVLLVS